MTSARHEPAAREVAADFRAVAAAGWALLAGAVALRNLLVLLA